MKLTTVLTALLCLAAVMVARYRLPELWRLYAVPGWLVEAWAGMAATAVLLILFFAVVVASSVWCVVIDRRQP